MQVTRHFIPLERKTPHLFSAALAVGQVDKHTVAPRFNQAHSFCDWVSMYQAHSALGDRLPLVNDGCFVRYDADGAHESTTLKKLRIEGSHDSSVYVRCDGETVTFEGNVSKFGRQDNVFGFSFVQCLARINAILATLGLPPFSEGVGYRSQINDKFCFTGARITRLDLTNNFQSGGPEDAYAFMRHLGMQQAARMKTGVLGQGETVDFGRGSRRVYSKAYLKGPELIRHMKKQSKGQISDFSRPYDPYTEQLAAWCDSIGLVRFETTYKSTYLIDNSQNYLGGLNMPVLEIDFLKRQEVFTRANCEVDELASLDKAALSCYRMWQAGDDITTKYKKSQFYKLRSKLLPYGIDIAIKSNLLKFEPKVKVIKLTQCNVPDFYQIPSPTNLRLVA